MEATRESGKKIEGFIFYFREGHKKRWILYDKDKLLEKIISNNAYRNNIGINNKEISNNELEEKLQEYLQKYCQDPEKFFDFTKEESIVRYFCRKEEVDKDKTFVNKKYKKEEALDIINHDPKYNKILLGRQEPQIVLAACLDFSADDLDNILFIMDKNSNMPVIQPLDSNEVKEHKLQQMKKYYKDLEEKLSSEKLEVGTKKYLIGGCQGHAFMTEAKAIDGGKIELRIIDSSGAFVENNYDDFYKKFNGEIGNLKFVDPEKNKTQADYSGTCSYHTVANAKTLLEADKYNRDHRDDQLTEVEIEANKVINIMLTVSGLPMLDSKTIQEQTKGKLSYKNIGQTIFKAAAGYEKEIDIINSLPSDSDFAKNIKKMQNYLDEYMNGKDLTIVTNSQGKKFSLDGVIDSGFINTNFENLHLRDEEGNELTTIQEIKKAKREADRRMKGEITRELQNKITTEPGPEKIIERIKAYGIEKSLKYYTENLKKWDITKEQRNRLQTVVNVIKNIKQQHRLNQQQALLHSATPGGSYIFY